MNKKEKEELARLDRQLLHWAVTDKAHKAEVKQLEKLHKHDLDWFDLETYQKQTY